MDAGGLPHGGVTWQVRTQDPERAEVTAYQDGVWLGRARRRRGEQDPWNASGQAG
jgi:hypothetical protein